MTTKIEHVQDAYSKLRISGLTVNPSPSDLSLGINRLENMMAELEVGRSLCLGYNFEENPDPTTESGIERYANEMVSSGLAVLLSPDFNKPPSQLLMMMASKSYSSVSARVAADNIRQVQYPSRMPIGSGNQRAYTNQRYNIPVSTSTNNCASKMLKTGEINDYIESFTSYLDGETITSYTIVADSGLTVVSSSKSASTVSYRIKAVTAGYQTVVIVITSSAGRIEERTIEFEVV